MAGMKPQEIKRVTHGYIGVSATDILDDFSHKSLKEFYPRYCELDIDMDSFMGNLRKKFEAVLASVPPRDQAKILRGVVAKCPVTSFKKTRTTAARDELLKMADRLEGAMQAPNLKEMTESTWRAIEDAKVLLKTNGPISAVDRVHTAIHAYLKLICDVAEITCNPDANVEALFGLIRDQHMRFKDLATRSKNIVAILRSMAKVFTAVNDIRNNESMAHPNELLEEDEAMLVINAAWTALHYIDSKLP
jgi:hypothetical protein